MTDQEVKLVLLISLSSYSTSSDVSITDWFRCQEARRKHPTLTKRIKKLSRTLPT